MTVTRIDFVDNATTREAGVYAVRYGWAFVKGVCREVNEFVHRLPWVCIGAVLIVATSVSYVCIAEARAERDKANKAQMELQQQVEQLSCAVEAERSAQQSSRSTTVSGYVPKSSFPSQTDQSFTTTSNVASLKTSTSRSLMLLTNLSKFTFYAIKKNIRQ